MDQVWIVILWDGDVVHAAPVLPGRCFSLGEGRGAWPFPQEFLGVPTLQLVDFRGTNPQVLVRQEPKRLCPGERLALDLGPVRVVVSYDEATGEAAPGFRAWGKYPLLRHGVASAGVMSALLTALAFSVPELTPGEAMPQDRERLKSVFDPYPGMFRQVFVDGEDPEIVLPDIALTPVPFLNRVDSSASCGDDADMGKHWAVGAARYAVSGPVDNPDPHLSRFPEFGPQRPTGNQERDLVGVLLVPMANFNAPPAPWGRDNSMGTDEVSARGNLWGDRVADAEGEESLAKAGVDGGMLKKIEVQRTVKENPLRVPRLLHTQLNVSGPLDSVAVERGLLPLLEPARQCYGADASSHGDHEGRLELQFDVEQDGSLQNIRAAQALGVEPAVTQCIVGHLKGVSLPPASKSSAVSYPLVLIPGSSELPQKVAEVPLAPEMPRPVSPSLPCGTRHRGGRTPSPAPCSR